MDRRIWHIRPPDLAEERAGSVLQIWGEEGYWHIVDEETRDLVQAVSEPTTLAAVLNRHPRWEALRELAARTLQSISQGLLQAPRPADEHIENVSVNLTAACNLHCATCYVPASERGKQQLDAGRALAWLERLGDRLSRSATISLLGGEPFLHPRGVLALAQRAQRRGYVCTVSTNGTLSLADWIPEIRRTGLRVQVSLDGASAAVNDAIRGAGTHAKALRTAQELIAARIHTTLCLVACRENLEEIGDYLRLARRIGANEARIIPLKRLGNAKNGKPAPVSPLALVQQVAAELERDPRLEALCQSDLYAILKRLVRESSRRWSCGSGTQTLLLQADGRVYPCLNTTLPEALLGTDDDDLQALAQKGRDWGRRLSIDNPSHPCHSCAVKRWCLAGCPGETLQREGALHAVRPDCADLRGAILFMMWQSSKGPVSDEAGRTRI